MKKGKKNKKFAKILGTSIITFSMIVGLAYPYNKKATYLNTTPVLAVAARNSSQQVYLSDMDYIENKSSVGWGSILKDKDSNDNKITVRYENNNIAFDKGVFAHATSTLVYDLTNYSRFDYFTAYVGLNTSAIGRGNGVKFYIYTSTDGENWELKTEENPKARVGADNAVFEKIDIKGAKYLKLYANDNGGNGSDHSVYADAKLVTQAYLDEQDNLVKPVSYYDNLIKQKYNGGVITDEVEHLLLQRELINCVGYNTLKIYVSRSEENAETFHWLFDSLENLRLYILGGKPDITRQMDPTRQTGVSANENYISSLNVLNELYQTYKSDTELTETTKYGTKLGYLYKKMIMSISLTHARTVGLWAGISEPENQSKAVTRYKIYKEMHQKGYFKVNDNMDITKIFEGLEVEEMRFVFNAPIDDEEVEWFNRYSYSEINKPGRDVWWYLSPHPYIKYTWENYGKPEYYDPARVAEYSAKYGNFLSYGVTSRPGLAKFWMTLDNGAVCGGISKTGVILKAVRGLPATAVSQPGHSAYIFYYENSEGKGYWSMDNDVYGWSQSGRNDFLNYRMPLGYGNQEYIHFHQDWLGMATYVLLAQGALNDFENYKTSRELLIVADINQEDNNKLMQVYRDVVNAEPLNIDGWYGLIKAYNKAGKTESEKLALAKEIMEKLKYYPLPMYHLVREIKKGITSPEYDFAYTLELQKTLIAAKNATDADTIQRGAVVQEANYLLGNTDTSLSTFSFDGDDAGKIVLTSRYDGIGVRWDYSLDGKNKWTEVSFNPNEEHKKQLSASELNSITAENDIYIHIVGVDYSDANVFKIDITEQAAPTGLYGNDLENKVIGATDKMEWRMEGTNFWTSYKTATPDLTGDKKVYVRIGKTGTKLASPENLYTFTKDIENPKEKYVTINRLAIENFSSEASGQGRFAKNAIDGNYETNWHSAWNGSDTNRYITIKVDNPIYLSALDYVPGGGGNGKILDGKIYGSLDGENYKEIGTISNWANNDDTKTIRFENPELVKYIKIQGTRTSTAGGGSFIVARMFNLYEDGTKAPAGELEYSTKEKTNQDVVVKLINLPEGTIITNNEGSNTYTFTKNGEFTFEFERSGLKGSATAIVSNIDKENPTATVAYSTTTETTENVIATLSDISEEIIITNNNGKTTYTFTENGEFTFEYVDKAGNKGSTKAVVTWITKKTTNPVEPIKPVKPTEPVVPINPVEPVKPVTPINPVVPTKPITPTSPNTNNTIKKPVTSNNNGTSNGNNTTTNQNNTSTNTNNTQNNNSTNNLDSNKYTIYTSNYASIVLPKSYEDKKVTFKTVDLVMSNTLKEKVTSSSVYFNAYLENNQNNKVPLTDVSTVRIYIDQTRELVGIYREKNDVLSKINYTKKGNIAEFKTKELGNFMIVYTDVVVRSEIDVFSEEETTSNVPVIELIGIGCASLGAGLGILFLAKRKKEDNK